METLPFSVALTVSLLPQCASLKQIAGKSANQMIQGNLQFYMSGLGHLLFYVPLMMQCPKS